MSPLGWILTAIVYLVRWWLALVIGVAMRAWRWIWARPWPLRSKVLLVFAPHALALALFAGATTLRRHDTRTVPGSLHAVASPPRPPRSLRVAPATWQRRSGARSSADLVCRSTAFAVGGLYGAPFLFSLVFLGPLWAGLAHWKRHREPLGTVAGRPITLGVAARFSKLFPKWRALADRERTWFVGGSATGRGPLMISTDARVTHTWVVGATGTGKTQGVLLPLLRSEILAGRAVVFLDGKGDRETIAAAWDLATRARREGDFRYFDLRTPDRSDSYSPLLSGTPNEQCDRIMAALRWDNEYYRSQSQSVLLDVLRAIRATGQPFTLDDVLVALTDLAALRRLATLIPEEERTDLESVAERWKDYQRETSGLRAQLKVLLSSDYGALLKQAAPTLDLAEAYRSRQIVYFALPVARFPESAPLVAKLIIGDLNAVAGRVQDGELAREAIAVVIDEFASFATPGFVDLLNKARSAGMAITIAHQSMRGDLATAGDGYADRVADNTNIKICLRQSEDAEYVAGLAGTYHTHKSTEQIEDSLVGQMRTGLGSIREVDEYVVSPNIVRELPPGWAVVKMNQPSSYIDLVRLDFVSTSGLPAYEPPLRAPRQLPALDLRRGLLSPSPPLPRSEEPVTPVFEGA